MKKGKKLTAAMTAYAVVASMVVPTAFAGTASFTDINDSFAKDAILKLADAGILNGYNGKFNPTGQIERQDFAIILAKALKLDTASAPATATFSDIPKDHYAFAAVEACVKNGLIKGVGDGKYGNGTNLSREDMAVMFGRALNLVAGKDIITGKASKLNFTDAADIADYAKDAVGAAFELGYISGSNGKFDPKGTATREQVASLATRWMTAADSVKVTDLKIAGKTNVGIGEKVQFSVAGAKNVSWSVSGNGVIDQAGNFVGNASGSATVTAVADGKTLTATVNIYGVAKAVKIDVQKDLLSNGKSNEVITAYAVDANGNNVENFEGTATVAITTTGAAKLIAKGDLTSSTTFDSITNPLTTLTFKGGKAEFVAVAGKVPGLKDTITVSALTNANGLAVNGFTAATADVKTVAQIATSIKVTASKTILAANDNSDKAKVTAKVLDQDGKEMLTGTYGLKFNISGVANWASGDQKENANSFTGGVVAPSLNVVSVQGVTGSSTVTVTADGLTAGSVTITSSVAGNAAKLVVSDADGAVDFVQGQVNADLTVSTTDANGTPSNNYVVDGTKALYAFVVDADGNNADNFTINGQAVTENGVHLTGTGISLTNVADTAAAGSYKLIVKDTAATGALTSTELPFKVLADENSNSKTLSFKVANNIVPASNPTTTVTAQVTDQFGNKLAKQDVPVTFKASNATTKASFNGGSKLSNPEVTVNTDANGLATATFTADAYDNQTWTLTPSVSGNYGFGPLNTLTRTIKVAYLVPASMGVSLTAAATNSTYQVVAGTGIKINLSQKDAYGNSLAGLNSNVKVTIASPSGVKFPNAVPGVTVDTTAGTISGTLNAVQQYLDNAGLGLTARKAGTVTFTVENTSVAGVSAGSGVINVLPGAQTGFALFDANGKLISSSNQVKVEANKEVALYVKPVDGQGNVVAANNDYTVNLADVVGNGNFRLASNGASSSAVSFPNGYSSIGVYYVNAKSGSYEPTVSAQTGTLTQATLVATAIDTFTLTTTDSLGTKVDAPSLPTVTVTGGKATAANFQVTQTGTGTYEVKLISLPANEDVTAVYHVKVTAKNSTSNEVTIKVADLPL